MNPPARAIAFPQAATRANASIMLAILLELPPHEPPQQHPPDARPRQQASPLSRPESGEATTPVRFHTVKKRVLCADRL
jgi:hypothetical protein